MEMISRALVIAAHPDDEVLGMGGTVAKLTSEGKEVHLLIVTDGSTSQYKDSEDLEKIINDKKAETLNCANALGIKSVLYGGLPDMKLDVTPHIEVNAVIEKAIEEIAPDTVFTHFWGDVNMDHRCVYHSTMVAVRPTATQVVKNVYCYSVPSSTEWSPCVANTAFMPNVYVDISNGFLERKCEGLNCYKTELRDYPHPRSIEHIKKQDNAEVLKVGVESAESFVLLRSVVR